MTDATLKQAIDIWRAYMAGQVSYEVAQSRLRFTGYRLDDPVLAAEVARQDQAQQAAADAAEARRRQQDTKVNAYIRREHERTKGITVNDGL
jgi:hypothetical protein